MSTVAIAAPMTAQVRAGSPPRSAQIHLLNAPRGAQLFVVDGSRLYDLPDDLADAFRAALDRGDDAVARLVETSGIAALRAVDDVPLAPMPAHALSLAIAQKCNLGCA